MIDYKKCVLYYLKRNLTVTTYTPTNVPAILSFLLLTLFSDTQLIILPLEIAHFFSKI